MLKGHVFAKQLFGNPVFAAFIDGFTGGQCGISNNYKEGMSLSYSGSNVTVNSGIVCIRGRFLEEDTSTTLSAGTNTAYCKLIVEVDLDKQNTETEFNQGAYKIITGTSSYPALTQTNIVKNNAGVYQYELARFRTSSSGITEFQDMRTFLDFDTIFEYIQQKLEEIEQQSNVLLKTGGTLSGEIEVSSSGDISGNISANARKCK